MAPATQAIRNNEVVKTEYSEKSAIDALYNELSKGIESLKKSDVYTIDEAWEAMIKYNVYGKTKEVQDCYFERRPFEDIKSTKKYILDTFKYREYAENFSKKIKKAVKELDSFPKGYEATGYVIEGLNIYFKPLIFFVAEDSTITVIRVLKDRMYWQAIIKRMQEIRRPVCRPTG